MGNKTIDKNNSDNETLLFGVDFVPTNRFFKGWLKFLSIKKC